MTRALPEWIGKTPDSAIPPRVSVRLFEKAGKKCQHCQRPLFGGDKWQVDHIIALVNGGENREGNLQVLCDWCHKKKTAGDVAVKSKTYRVKAKHLAKARAKGRALPGTKASGIRKRMNGDVERWEE